MEDRLSNKARGEEEDFLTGGVWVHREQAEEGQSQIVLTDSRAANGDRILQQKPA